MPAARPRIALSEFTPQSVDEERAFEVLDGAPGGQRGEGPGNVSGTTVPACGAASTRCRANSISRS